MNILEQKSFENSLKLLIKNLLNQKLLLKIASTQLKKLIHL